MSFWHQDILLLMGNARTVENRESFSDDTHQMQMAFNRTNLCNVKSNCGYFHRQTV